MKSNRNLHQFCLYIIVLTYTLLFLILAHYYWNENGSRNLISIITFHHQQHPTVHTAKNHTADRIDVSIVQNTSKYWSFFNFLRNTKKQNGETNTVAKKRICILNVDTRPLEQFSIMEDFDKMSFHSITAYNSLFYGKNKFDKLRTFFIDFLNSSYATWISL